MKKKSTLTIVLGIVIIIAALVGGVKSFGLFSIIPTSNLLKNGDMEAFCKYDAVTKKSYTDDIAHLPCAASFPVYDHTETTGVAAWPYDWDFQYGTGLFKYTGTEACYIGTSCLLLSKQTNDDWYGFGYGNIPAEAGKVYEAYVYAKKLSSSGDDRECSFNIVFRNGAGQELTKGSEATSSNLGAGKGAWEKIQAQAIAPLGTTSVGFNMWCPQNGHYQYLVDGQYIGTTTMCTVGATQSCGTYNVGACRYGTQTCNANGVFGTCTGAVNPVHEVCGDKIDNNCDGQVDEQCTNVSTGGNSGNDLLGNFNPIIGSVSGVMLLIGGIILIKGLGVF